jgi:hypothetical protein
MVSSLTSSNGLTAANIATLFGTAASSSDSTTKDGTKTSAGVTSGTPITGAGSGGTNAAKAIQTIVTQIQLEKMQTSVQGKVVSTLDSASIAVSYDKTVNLESGTFSVGVTALNSVATATGNDTAGAVGTLMTQVKAQQAQVMAAQNGTLFTHEEAVLGGRSGSSSAVWTANSVTLNMNETANQGLELSDQEGALNGILNITGEAQQFQAPSVTSTPAANAQPVTSSDNVSGSSPSSGANGSAIYLEVSRYHGSFSALNTIEQQMVSDFEKGALPGQSGTAPENGDGFSYSWDTGDQAGSSYSIKAVMISNYDPAAVATRSAIDSDQSEQSAWMTADQETAAMGGTVVADLSGPGWGGSDEMMGVIIPLKSS